MAERFRIPAPPRLPPLAASAVAIGLPLLMFALDSVFRVLLEGVPFVLFLLAVALASWVGGLVPGLVSVALSAALGYAFLRGSADPATVSGAHLAIAVFIPAAAVITAIGAAARAGFRERERVAETLRRSEARERAKAEELQAIMDAVPAAVLIAHDPDARTLTGSRAAYDLLRVPPGVNVSKSGERPPVHYRVMRNGKELSPQELPTQVAARSGARARDVEFEIVFDDGTRRTLLGNAEPLFDDQGRSRGAVSAFVDVTKLSEAVRTRDAFLSMASHELKTPITSLQLQVGSLLRAREGVPAPVAKAADATRRQVVRLTSLVNTLLDVSRLNEGRLQLEIEPVDLSALVSEVASRFVAETERSESRIRVDAAEAVCGRWDRLRLEQVLTNLLSNALKYGEGKPVSVRVQSDGATARLAVVDHGIGIAPSEQRRIFERFERGPATRGYGGFGLGLWITREIVSALGGTIHVESAPGAGSTFRVELPVTGPAAGASASERGDPA
ncbi:ATP-binding protein [Anaeromyxobacter sp. Fw109-5]|uniref:sensor histidine kinase n=1 Tax=Anaeromyxobacter sp. (strain Fw109-5) TaxID=404589 RepID=UPI0000ED8BBD|nr:ATP-binding protein [Anaeromyxobacter sp. Fw109-5]ABS26344.1 histidine kinase [Anaeromyxobacter sp. Fw109-5]